MTTIILYAALIVGTGIALGVGIGILKRVMSKAKDQGVKLSDGLQLNEAALIAKLLEDEMKQNAELESLKNLKRVIDKAMAPKEK